MFSIPPTLLRAVSAAVLGEEASHWTAICSIKRFSCPTLIDDSENVGRARESPRTLLALHCLLWIFRLFVVCRSPLVYHTNSASLAKL